MMRSERCRVVVKCRPTFPSEEEALDDGIQISAPGGVFLKEGKQFEADHAYLPSDGDLVYEDEVQALVASLYEGINSTVFAYGASGSGKTHTVLGCKDSPGLVDRITDEVFARYDQRSCTVSVSVEELYCERFTDLLAASAHPPTPINSRSSSSSSFHGARSTHVKPPLHRQASQTKYNWQKVTLNSSSETKALVQHVLRKRHTASTCLNDKSSRSHVIVTITLEQRKAITEHKYAEDEEPLRSSASSMTSAGAGSSSSSSVGGSAGSTSDLSSLRQQDSVDSRSVPEDTSSEAGSASAVDTYLIGKLYLVDLAGSENIKKSGAEGLRQKEAGEINKSLCHLKTVIQDVFEGRRVTTYRNSKLTFRLQDALGGGNSKLLVVACISTARSNLPETKETLRFAEMARAITNTPVVNREPKDELIHRLQLQLAELQDQVKLAKEESGRAATEEVLQQLNVVEAAYADLQEEMEAKEATWTKAAFEVQEKVAVLHGVLSVTKDREAAVRQELVQEQAAMQRLLQQLTSEQASLQGSQQAVAAAASLLLSMREEVCTIQQHCSTLQEQVESQRGAAAAAAGLCAEQQGHALELQQQVSAQALELGLLRQQLQDEHVARAAADIEVAGLQQQCSALQQQLKDEQAATAAAVSQSVEQQQHVQELQQQLAAQAQELEGLRQQLQQECSSRAAADMQVASLRQHQDAMRAASRQCADEAQQGMLHLAALCQTLQGQVAAAAAQQAQAQQQHQAVLQSMCVSEAAQQAVVQELAAAKQEVSKQQQDSAELLQRLRKQEQEHTAVLSATAAATTKAAADAAKEHLKQRQALEQKLQGAQDSVAKLQAQLEDERSEHEAILSAERLRHSQQLAESMHSSVKKLTADKLRCREHMSLQVFSLKAEAQSLSQALASPSYMLPEAPDSRPVSPSSNASGSSSPVTALGFNSLSPALQPSKRVSPVPPLQLDNSITALSDRTAAPMQDASERNLSGEETGTDTCSSEASSPGGGAMGAAAATAALVAVAAAAAAATATRAAAAYKGLTPRSTVSVHVEAGSQGGLAPPGGQHLSRGNSICTSEGRCSPTVDMMLPLCGSVSASPSLCSVDGSQHSGMHPAAAAAASAAAAAVAARVRSSHEQQSRHRRRRREFSKCFSSGCWPINYLPKEEVDMAAAAAAFNQLRGGALNVESLQRFLEHRMLGGRLHVKTLSGGGRKRKHQLVQDMMAYHRWHLANCGAGSSDTSSAGTGAAASTGVTPTPRSSACSSPESDVWHPLALARPASAAPSSAMGSPAKADLLRYSYDSPSPAVKRSSGGGSFTLEPGLLMPGRAAAFAVDAEEASRAGQQADVAATEQHPQQQQQQQSGRWSWLTPRRRKQQSILAQLQANDKSAHKKHDSIGSSPARYSADTAQPLQLSVQLPEFESEGGCDAVSPRDKKHAAAASRASKADSGSNPNSQPGSPKKFSLNGRAISACTGSAVSDFYVNSPAVKLAPGGSSRSSSRQRGRTDPLRMSVDAGSAHRSNWRQVQLTRTK